MHKHTLIEKIYFFCQVIHLTESSGLHSTNESLFIDYDACFHQLCLAWLRRVLVTGVARIFHRVFRTKPWILYVIPNCKLYKLMKIVLFIIGSHRRQGCRKVLAVLIMMRQELHTIFQTHRLFFYEKGHKKIN